MQIVLLQRAFKNVGDFLIAKSAERILSYTFPEFNFIKLHSAEPLDDNLKEINNSTAVVICGGPGYQRNFYPEIYPLTKNLKAIKPPIIPFGLGWYGFPGDEKSMQDFRFTDESLKAINFIHQRISSSSCRDFLTKSVLRRNGIENVMVTGCPSWFDLDYIGKEFQVPKSFKKVVFTTPQKKIYFEQARNLIKSIKKMFPRAELYCVFHRGIEADKFTTEEEAERLRFLKENAESFGYKVVDAAYDLSKIDFYRECDLHIGYRVHAHIRFLSLRKPSILVEEDSRGRGVNEALGLKGVRAWERVPIFESKEPLKNIIRLALQKPLVDVKEKDDVSDEVGEIIQNELDTDFMSFLGLDKKLDNQFAKTVSFLKTVIQNEKQ
jgi:hypothetical protein